MTRSTRGDSSGTRVAAASGDDGTMVVGDTDPTKTTDEENVTTEETEETREERRLARRRPVTKNCFGNGTCTCDGEICTYQEYREFIAVTSPPAVIFLVFALPVAIWLGIFGMFVIRQKVKGVWPDREGGEREGPNMQPLLR